MMANEVTSRAEWLGWRTKGIGSSDAAAIAGRSRYRTPLQVYLEKTGQGSPQQSSDLMKWGLWLEPAIAAAYQDRTGCTYEAEQRRVEWAIRPWMRATLDRVRDDGIIVELKSTSYGMAKTLGEDGDIDSLPDEWLLQVQHQMAVSGCDITDIAVYLPTPELRIYTVERDDRLIKALCELEAEFWDHVQRRVPPPAIDYRDAESLVRLNGIKDSRVVLGDDASSLASQYTELQRDSSEVERGRQSIKSQLLHLLNGNEYGELPDGRIIRCHVIEVAERTQTVKAHSQIRLSIREPREKS